ncbi:MULTISPECIES: DUF4145 domain-containing protein [Enterobacteriaceae]|uniref:DUF4145 domain-containing protein n=1 Tax=Enterobacteriaceae TaxID=543 RepID=UPI00037F0DD0|nr:MULTISPECIES: DUF4145 domain-containing protein [Enterobacteriaceae]EMC5569738.1 DUF4145 domain-containing protein [Salmonella enterica]DAP79760.1 MAG TPA: nucleic-acid-binding protein [Caudoviricetes sp.]EGI6871029.1 DUF4145 domain-containing protein [Escherichia coli]ELT9998415.1 DUF4145 domain-containing protein [Escherichia coli]MBJ9571564.1 DUF4145 domain-containing protein [Citrobacter braakii]
MVTLVDDCPRCGSQKISFDFNGLNCTKVYTNLGGAKTYEYEIYCVCRECRQTTMFMCWPLEKNKTLDGYNWGSGLFGLREVVEVGRPVSPADIAVDEPPEFLPEHINNAYEEGAKCLAIGCYNAAATMFRLCLDYATKGLVPEGEQGPAQKIKRSLGLRMEWLFDNHLLPESLRELAECVKDDGNDGAHEGILDKAAAEDLEDFTYLFLERLYTEPQRLIEARTRREQRRKK